MRENKIDRKNERKSINNYDEEMLSYYIKENELIWGKDKSHGPYDRMPESWRICMRKRSEEPTEQGKDLITNEYYGNKKYIHELRIAYPFIFCRKPVNKNF